MSARWSAVLLWATDYEGANRELWCDSLAQADTIAVACTQPDDMFRWQAYEVWTWNPDEWDCVRLWPVA